MRIEQIGFQDIDEIRKLQPSDWGDIIPDIEFYIHSSFCKPIKVTIENRIVGIGTLIIFGNTGWLAHIIVDHYHRNRGFGALIVNELLNTAKSYSVETCSLIATQMGAPVYLKAGFRKVTDYVFLMNENHCIETSLSENIVPYDEKYCGEIYELDRMISGENRETLLKHFLSDSILFVEFQRVTGFYLPSLKEGLIVSLCKEAGLELMKYKYATKNKAVIPIDNTEAIEFLIQMGFVETSTASRMVFGKDIKCDFSKIYSRIAGNLG